MTRCRTLMVAMMMLALLAACGKSTVVRTSPRGTAPAPRSVTPPSAGDTAVVSKGDTVYGIATRYGISPLDLAMWNRISPPYTIYPGQRMRLTAPPDAGRGGAASRNDPPPIVSTTPQQPPRPPVTAPPKPLPPTTPPPAAGFTWRWPADGPILGGFAAGDPTRQGIDIGGKSGSPVRAAADGVVVYSGAGLVGYGELIIVKHDDQWLSAYGHNRARLVNEGQQVKAGEQIAEMGRSGASRDMLHFEIRYNGKPQDPQLTLPKR